MEPPTRLEFLHDYGYSPYVYTPALVRSENGDVDRDSNNYGYLHNVIDLVASDHGVLALKTDGSVAYWGNFNRTGLSRNWYIYDDGSSGNAGHAVSGGYINGPVGNQTNTAISTFTALAGEDTVAPCASTSRRTCPPTTPARSATP